MVLDLKYSDLCCILIGWGADIILVSEIIVYFGYWQEIVKVCKSKFYSDPYLNKLVLEKLDYKSSQSVNIFVYHRQ